MNFVQWLSSLDELLYELMSWLVFFPVTLWRIVTRPLATMRYAEEQLILAPEQQYRGTVSPPIMLILAIMVSQAIGLAVDGTNPIVANRHGLAGLVDDNTTLLLLRVVLFGVFAVIMATRKVTRAKAGLDRDTLKAPFYAQCYVTSPLALLVSVGSLGIAHALPTLRVAGALALGSGLIVYGVVQVRWLRRELNQSIGRSVFDASVGVVQSIVIFFGVGFLFTR